MGRKPRTRMPREQRAKQFAPFQAVGGLYEALRQAEEEHRREIEEGSVQRVSMEEEIPEDIPGDPDEMYSL